MQDTDATTLWSNLFPTSLREGVPKLATLTIIFGIVFQFATAILFIRLIFLALLCFVGKSLFSLLWTEWSQCTKTRARTGQEFIFKEYFLYRLDYHFSRNPKLQGVAVGFAAISIIFIGGILWCLATEDGIVESLWTAWTFVADPGTHADSSGAVRRMISFALTLGGMVIFASVIGIISEDISLSLENLRKGKSRVIESNHTLILGQGDKLIPTVQQIALANASCGGGLVVILTTLPKEELEYILQEADLDLRGTEVIVRKGIAHMQSDLRKVSAAGARSVIVLADRAVTNPDMTDVNTVRTVLSLRGIGAPSNGHIVCEVCDVDNEDLVKLVGREHVETIVSHDVVGRLMIQCALEPGLAQVLDKLLGFEDNEFYINDCAQWTELFGLRFDQLMYRFDAAVVIGYLRAKTEFTESATVELNPPGDSVFREGDSLIVIAEDDDTYSPRVDGHRVSKKHIETVKQPVRDLTKKTERMLFVGWRRDMDDMINQLDYYVSPGSQLTLFSDHSVEEREERLKAGGMDVQRYRSQLPVVVEKEVERDDEERFRTKRASSMPLMDLTSGDYVSEDVFSEPPSPTHIKQNHHSRFRFPPMDSSSSSMMYNNNNDLHMMTLKNLHIFHRSGNQTSRKDLEFLPLEAYDSILILADEELEASENAFDMVYADSRSLTTLLLIRDIQGKRQLPLGRKAALISEILDPRTKSLLSVGNVSDYVTSNELVSMAIAMVAEQRAVNSVLKELFSTHGNQIKIKGVREYIRHGAQVSFWEVGAQIVLNPSDKGVRRLWDGSDELVVLEYSGS
eukprot:gene8177-16802_t